MNAKEPERDADQVGEKPQSFIGSPELSFTDEERERYAAAAREVEAILAKQKRRRRSRR